MEAKLLTNIVVLLFIFVQECVGSCSSYDSDCNDGFAVWRVWYLWVVIIIVISLCCGGCGAYRRRRIMMQQQQAAVIVGPGQVVAVPQGQMNYGYNQGPTAAMAPPSYSAAATSPTTYPPPAGSTYPPPAGAAYPPPAGTTYPPTSPSAPGAPVYNTYAYGNPNAAENKSALPSEPPPAYNEAVKEIP